MDIGYSHASHNLGSSLYFDELKLSLYEKVEKNSANHPGRIRALAPLIALGTQTLNLAKRISQVAEAPLKGLFNIVACPFSEDAKFLRGVRFLAIYTPYRVAQLAFSVIDLPARFVITTLRLFIMPQGYSKSRKEEIEIDIQDNRWRKDDDFFTAQNKITTRRNERSQKDLEKAGENVRKAGEALKKHDAKSQADQDSTAFRANPVI
jgi:hypothetical protein